MLVGGGYENQMNFPIILIKISILMMLDIKKFSIKCQETKFLPVFSSWYTK